MRLFVNVDQEGNITQSLYGEFVVDLEDEFEYFFEIPEGLGENIEDYMVVEGELIKR